MGLPAARRLTCATAAVLLLLGVAAASADEPAGAEAPAAAPPATAPRYVLPAAPQLEPKAIELLQAG